MAKELPYFRFTAFEWLNDDISLESYELKGLFIDICAYYWFKDCSLTLAMLNKRFSNAKVLLEQLFDLAIIKAEDTNEYIRIKFLDEQFDILSEKRKKRQDAGRKGGLNKAKNKSSNAKAMLKQKPSYKDNNKDKDDIRNRKQVFKTHINNILKTERVKYINNKQDIIEFFEYWTEHGIKDKKMRFEKEKSFGISRRLDTWFKNKEKFNNKKPNLQKDQSDFTKKDTGWN
jgi:hypothetical protein